ncbi:matrix-remodeling-associated protein 7 [Drosophila albomicans]|uniref:Matrix-remodeling-associated protein 7 n=1 Tax=Drosophila albomicans TaxID=7291 RepID=A0A6P8YGV3_DROAB|nr:matrix-remodeling-associated protein 7 [Drosophila albomicans]
MVISKQKRRRPSNNKVKKIMQHTVKAAGDIWFDPSGYYVVALTTLLLCILISLYFANFLKDDTELEDEGIGAEVRMEDDAELQAQLRSRLQREIDDDEAYEEDEEDDEEEQLEAFSESDGDGDGDKATNNYNYSNLMGKIKAKHYQHQLAENLSPSQIEEERRIEREQLAAIFELLRKQEDELNLKDRISDSELKQQVKLYR